jgi:hypothetical protein
LDAGNDQPEQGFTQKEKGECKGGAAQRRKYEALPPGNRRQCEAVCEPCRAERHNNQQQGDSGRDGKPEFESGHDPEVGAREGR